MGKRSTEIEILGISRDSRETKADEIIHEEELVVELNKEIHKFYCIPGDLEEMIAGNLKSSSIDPHLSQVKKLGCNKLEVNFSGELVNTPRKYGSQKKLTRGEVFDPVEALNKNSSLF